MACFCTGECRRPGGRCPADNFAPPFRPATPAPPAMPGWRCPNCGAGVSPLAVVCTNCLPPAKVTCSE